MPWTKVISESTYDKSKPSYIDTNRKLTYQQAIKEAIDQSMNIDENVIVLGEGVDTAGYIYDTTKHLSERFGKDRVIETPISEAAITGIALGASIAGMKPVLIHMRNDFLLVSMDQIINHISHWKKLFNYDTPLVIRAIIARGWGSGAQHSQSFHGLFSGFEGLDVVMPYTPYDVKGMFLKAISSDKPTLFLEHRWLHNDIGYVPENPYFVDTDKSSLIKEGKDITIIGMSLTNRDALKCSEILENENISLECIDLKSIYPIDKETIIKSVKKTGRVIILENGYIPNGISGELASIIYEECFGSLKKPIKRIGWKTSTILSGVKLEESAYFTIEEIIKEIRKMVR